MLSPSRRGSLPASQHIKGCTSITATFTAGSGMS